MAKFAVNSVMSCNHDMSKVVSHSVAEEAATKKHLLSAVKIITRAKGVARVFFNFKWF